MTDTANLGLPLIEASQAQKHVTHNEALRILDAAIQIAVRDRNRTAPPPDPAEGQRHVVAAGAGGAWAGRASAIATWQDGAWAFLTPRSGWCLWSVADDQMLVFDGAAWRDLRELPMVLENLLRLGVNTTAAAPNLLSVKSNAALFAAIAAAAGGSGDVRVQLAKETAAATASVVFSDNYSGRAEFGLVGSNAFKLKVSADGSTWTEALGIDPATGNLALPRGVALTGVCAPAPLAADQHNYNPAGLAAAAVLQLSATAARSISGIAGGADGRLLGIVNTGTQTITLLDDNAASASANRLALGGDLSVPAKQAALLRYDGTAARWQAIARPPGAPADLDITLAELAMQAADNAGAALVLGGAGNRFADSFRTLSQVDVAGAANLDSSTAGVLKPALLTSYANPGGSGNRSAGIAASTTFSLGAGSAAVLINGSLTDNSCYPNSGQTSGNWTFDFGAGNARYIDEIRWYQSAAQSQGTYTFEGSNDNSSWSTIATGLNLGASATTTLAFTPPDKTHYRYVRLRMTAGATSNIPYLQEIEFKTGGYGNLTVRSAALTAAAAPSRLRLVARVKFIDAVTLGTDLKFSVSRDGGTSWTYASLTDRFTASGVDVLESGDIDLGAQPGGAAVKWRAESFNNKNFELHDIHLAWS